MFQIITFYINYFQDRLQALKKYMMKINLSEFWLFGVWLWNYYSRAIILHIPGHRTELGSCIIDDTSYIHGPIYKVVYKIDMLLLPDYLIQQTNLWMAIQQSYIHCLQCECDLFNVNATYSDSGGAYIFKHKWEGDAVPVKKILVLGNQHLKEYLRRWRWRKKQWDRWLILRWQNKMTWVQSSGNSLLCNAMLKQVPTT